MAEKRVKQRKPRSFTAQLLIFTGMMFAVFIIGTTLILSHIYSQELLNQLKTRTLEAFEVAEREIGTLLRDARVSLVLLQEDDDIQTYLRREFDSTLEMVQARRRVIEAVEHASMQQRALSGFLHIGSDSSFLAYLPNRSVFRDDAAHPFVMQYEEDIRRYADGSFHWIGPYDTYDVTRLSIDRKNMPANRLMLGMKVTAPVDGHASAISLVAVRSQTLLGAFEYMQDENAVVYLLNEAGAVITSTNEAAPVLADWLAHMPAPGESAATTVADRYLIYRRFNNTGWTLLKAVPKSIYLQSVSDMRRRAFLYAIVIIACFFAVYLMLVRVFLRPIAIISHAMEQMHQGDLSCRITQPMNTHEMNLIGQQFNRMAENIQNLIHTTQQMEREQVLLEMKNLQTQLSPHMIFNSITAIRWMATLMGANRVSDMLIELAELLRPFFREWRMEWTLGEEVAYMEHYVKLLRLRYGNNFHLTYDIPESLYACLIPRFTLQPLLENCCEHGGMNESTLHTSVHIWQEGNDILARISDNGQGIEPQALEQLQLMLAGADGTRRIGLYNVHRRIQLLYGQEYGLSISSTFGEGTVIDLRMRCLVKETDKLEDEKK